MWMWRWTKPHRQLLVAPGQAITFTLTLSILAISRDRHRCHRHAALLPGECVLHLLPPHHRHRLHSALRLAGAGPGAGAERRHHHYWRADRPAGRRDPTPTPPSSPPRATWWRRTTPPSSPSPCPTSRRCSPARPSPPPPRMRPTPTPSPPPTPTWPTATLTLTAPTAAGVADARGPQRRHGDPLRHADRGWRVSGGASGDRPGQGIYRTGLHHHRGREAATLHLPAAGARRSAP